MRERWNGLEALLLLQCWPWSHPSERGESKRDEAISTDAAVKSPIVSGVHCVLTR